METVASLTEPFFSWKQAPGRHFAESSRIKYEPILRHFAGWCGERAVESITTNLIEFEYLPLWTSEFRQRNGRPPAVNTVRLVENAISSLLDYAWRRGLAPTNPMLAVLRPEYEPRMNDWLSLEEDEALARVRMTPLEEIVTGLARLAGLRCAEVTGLHRGHVDLTQGLLHVYGTKSVGSIRSVVVFPELGEKLERWLAYQDARGFSSPHAWLVSTGTGGRVCESYIWRIVKRVAARAGVRLHGLDKHGRPLALDDTGENVSTVSPHTLRRTFGSDLLNRGARIEVVSAQLGHSSVKVTEQAYAKLLTVTQREELLRLGTGYPFLSRDGGRHRPPPKLGAC